MPIVTSDPDRVAGEILQYLAAHPQAADSLDGIAKWWLLSRTDTKITIEMALERLVRQGLVRKRVLPDGSIVYSRGRDCSEFSKGTSE